MNVLVVSPYKTGTHSIEVACINSGIPVTRTHGKCTNSPSHVITMVRNFTDQIISAYFQDISTLEYVYHFGTHAEVLAATQDALVLHFLKFDWTSYEHLSYQNAWGNIFESYGHLLDPTKKLPQMVGNVLAITIDASNDELNEQLSAFLGQPITIASNHKGKDKWYAAKYATFKRKFRDRIDAHFKIKMKNDPLFHTLFR